jgi:beta-galactosidase GanA
VQVGDLSRIELAAYKIVIAPSLMIIDEDALARLGAYIKQGGTFLADGRFALMNENNYVYEHVPGNDFCRVMGYEERDVRPVRPGTETITGGGLTMVNRSLFCLDIQPSGGPETAASFAGGKPAIIKKKYGKGSIIYCAFDLGYTYFHGYPEDCRRFFDRLTREKSSEFQINALDQNPLVSHHAYQTGRGLLVFILNYGGPGLAHFIINEKSPGGKITAIEGEVPEIICHESSLEIRKDLSKEEISVFVIQKEVKA